MGFIPGLDWFKIKIYINKIYIIWKGPKYHLSISVYSENSFTKIQFHGILKKNKPSKIENIGLHKGFLGMIKYINLNSMVSIIYNGKILEAFSLRSGIRQGYALLPLLIKNFL